MKKHFSIFVLAGCAAILLFGIVRLVELRFAQGEVYPEYSSLRADPLGTMVFYESLESMPGISARRDFSDLNRLPEEPQTAYLHLASPRYEWESMPADLFHELQNFLARGNRLVITFFPQTGPHVFHQYRGDDETNSVKSAKGKDEKMPEAKPAKSRKKPTADEPDITLEDKWEFHIGFEKLAEDGETYAPARAWNRTDLPLPETLDWHSGLVLTNCGSLWRTIYARGTNAVVVERDFGKGSVVIATDSYFVSNESMEQDRHADLLAAAGLAPAREEKKGGDFVSGKDSASGFVNLLRRSIAPRDLLATCFAEWKKSAAPAGKMSTARLQQAEEIFRVENSLPNRDRNPIAAYKSISNTLGTRNKKL